MQASDTNSQCAGASGRQSGEGGSPDADDMEWLPSQSKAPRPVAMAKEGGMKPIIIIPPKLMSAEDVKLLTDNGLCVVTAKDPALVKFLDPIPAEAQRSKIEHAAIKLSRMLLNGDWNQSAYPALGKKEFAELYIGLLMDGNPLDHRDTPEEQQQKVFNEVKHQEVCRLAREEAKAELAAKKKAEAKPA